MLPSEWGRQNSVSSSCSAESTPVRKLGVSGNPSCSPAFSTDWAFGGNFDENDS
jgi:hypothetical protein